MWVCLFVWLFVFKLGDVGEVHYGVILQGQKTEKFGRFPVSRAQSARDRKYIY